MVINDEVHGLITAEEAVNLIRAIKAKESEHGNV
jgi:hypothetical protein